MKHSVAHRSEHAAQRAKTATTHDDKIGPVSRGIFRNRFGLRRIGDGLYGHALIFSMIAQTFGHFAFDARKRPRNDLFVRIVVEQAPRNAIERIGLARIPRSEHARKNHVQHVDLRIGVVANKGERGFKRIFRLVRPVKRNDDFFELKLGRHSVPPYQQEADNAIPLLALNYIPFPKD